MLSGCMRDMSFLICRGRLHHAHLWQKPGTLEHEKEMNTPSCFGEALFSPPLSLLPSLSLSLSLLFLLDSAWTGFSNLGRMFIFQSILTGIHRKVTKEHKVNIAPNQHI